MNNKEYPVKRNQEMELTIEKLAYGGKGIAYYNDYLIFISDTVPGDIVKARIFRRKPNYAEARVLEILKNSSFRKDAPCPYFNWCGGCTWQNLDYNVQLKIKRDHIIESIRHIAKLENFQVPETIPAKEIWRYRNKMEFSFSNKRWLLPYELEKENINGSFALGLHIPGTYHKILSIDNCLLQSNNANKVLKLVTRYCQDHCLEPYDLHDHSGYLRFLVIRQSKYNNEIMVNIVTSENTPDKLIPLAKILKQNIPDVKSVINNINSRKAQIATGEEENILSGNDHIIEKFGDINFRISANSFFQINTLQALELYKIVLEYADVKKDDIIWDLYSGTGTISLFLAKKAKVVYGFEIAESAVADARVNAEINKEKKVQFISGDLLNSIKLNSKIPDIIITDPPRSGMHPKVCDFLNQLMVKRIIYVSCNPTTQARDIRLLNKKYKLERIQPVDMFPHTYHIETVSLLERR